MMNLIMKQKEPMIIVKVRFNKASQHKLLTVPKNCNLKVGDYVRLVKVESKE